MKLARHWEARGEGRFHDLAGELFRFGARVYQMHQPHFLSEFLLENLDPLRIVRCVPGRSGDACRGGRSNRPRPGRDSAGRISIAEHAALRSIPENASASCVLTQARLDELRHAPRLAPVLVR